MPFVPDCEVREGDDETVDRRAVNPVQKSGLRARTIYLGTARADLIMAWPQQRPTCKRPDTFVQTASSSLNDLARAGRVIHTFDELRQLELRIAEVNREIEAIASQSDTARRLMTIPGIGPLAATAL